MVLLLLLLLQLCVCVRVSSAAFLVLLLLLLLVAGERAIGMVASASCNAYASLSDDLLEVKCAQKLRYTVDVI